MAQARMVVTSIWRKSRKFRPLSKDAKLLYLYLITNEDTELCGAYEQHWDDLHRWAHLTHDEAVTAFSELERAGLAAYRDGWVIVIGYKVLGENPSIKKGIDASMDALPEWVSREMDVLRQAVPSVPPACAQPVPSVSTASSQAVYDLDLDSDYDLDSDKDIDLERDSDARATVETIPSTVDPISTHYRKLLSEHLPTTAWTDATKQAHSLRELTGRTRELLESTPYQTAEELASAIVAAFLRKRREEKSAYWRGAECTPAKLLQRYPEVVTALATEYEEGSKWTTR